MTTRDYFVAVLNAHISDEMDTVSQEFIAKMDARNEKRKSADSKAKQATQARRDAVLSFLSGNDGAFVRDDIAAATGLTVGQVTAACKSLLTDGAITKTEIKVEKSRKMAYSAA